MPTAIAAAVAACALIGMVSDVAWAGTSVTIPPGDPHDQQTITVTGTGFPDHVKDPTGMQILECSDPGGTTANLPSTNLFCDGSTINPSQINTTAQGSFTAKYTVYTLNSTHSSNITCDKTHYCVLWVGVDYNQDFYGPHAFSTPFEVGGAPSGSGSSSSSTIWIPVVAVVVVGGVLVVARSRRRPLTRSSSTS
ncbi:MAG TPA: hypothetical protein VII76_16960 [Acidimicrobiales bacterium]